MGLQQNKYLPKKDVEQFNENSVASSLLYFLPFHLNGKSKPKRLESPFELG